MKTIQFVLLLGIVLFAGCYTDKLVVFEDRVLSDDEMKPFLGTFSCVDASGNTGTGAITMEENKGRYRISMGAAKEKRKSSYGNIMLSEIPNSRTGLLLFSSPKMPCYPFTLKNFVGIVKKDNDTIYVWLVLPGNLVAKDHMFKSTSDGLSSTDVKSFLAKYADVYVLSNAPSYTFRKK